MGGRQSDKNSSNLRCSDVMVKADVCYLNKVFSDNGRLSLA